MQTVKPVDKFFLQVTLALMAVGLAFMFSASWHESLRYTNSPWTFIIKQSIAALFGLPLMFFVSSLHFKWWKQLSWILFFVVLILLALTATEQFGVVTGGSRRWLSLGLFQLQVSEFAKISVVIIMARAFSEFNFKKALIAVAMVLLVAAFVIKQPDLGTSILILSSMAFVAYASGVNLFLLMIVLAILSWLLWQWILHNPYQMERIQFWLNPYSDPLGHGYNLIQSINAIGSGGIWGVGYGNSLQKLGVLPISHADFIFSVICEETGFLGAVAVLLLFAAWILRALKISFEAADSFAKNLGIGLTGVIALQILINIGVALGLFPITGMTLPFVSFGGSSLISVCISTGIILNISRFSDNK